MQQQAWLNAAPGKAKLTRFARWSAESKQAGAVPSPYLTLPEVPAGVAHILDYLFEVGPTSGEHPITWGEIGAWRVETGTLLTEFEASSIRSLSKAYLGMLRAASETNCPAPVEREDTQDETLDERRARVDKQLRAIFKGLSDPKAKAARLKKQRGNRE